MFLKYLLFTLLFISIYFVNAQSSRFHYQLNYHLDSLGTSAKEILILEVKEKQNLFLNKKYLDMDSINKRNKGEKTYIMPRYSSVISYSKENKLYTTYKKVDIDYYKFNSQKSFNWKIENDKKKIADFNVQKATLSYGGRNWIAWFAIDIPLPYGPHYFSGLPGLILEIYDDDKNFHFSLIKIEDSKYQNQELKIDDLFDQEVKSIKEKDFPKILLNYYNNPLYSVKTIGWKMFKNNGEEFSSKDYKDFEKNIKQDIKRFNNLIEVDEKVNYK